MRTRLVFVSATDFSFVLSRRVVGSVVAMTKLPARCESLIVDLLVRTEGRWEVLGFAVELESGERPHPQCDLNWKSRFPICSCRHLVDNPAKEASAFNSPSRFELNDTLKLSGVGDRRGAQERPAHR
jgi:hypothetical protein